MLVCQRCKYPVTSAVTHRPSSALGCESGRVLKEIGKKIKWEYHSRGFWSGHSSKVVKGINISRALCFPPGRSFTSSQLASEESRGPLLLLSLPVNDRPYGSEGTAVRGLSARPLSLFDQSRWGKHESYLREISQE